MSSLTHGKISDGLDQFSLSYSNGQITLNDINGNTITQSNAVQIKLRDTDGTLKTYLITESFTFRDGTHAIKSDFLNSTSTVGMPFGTTSGVSWGELRPICIGWIHDGITAYPAFSFMPDGRLSELSSIGNKENPPSSPSDDNIIAWTSTNLSFSHRYKNFIPFATCTAIKSSSDDWTLYFILGTGDGVGDCALNNNFGSRHYEMPTGQNGAVSGSYFYVATGTPPTVATPAAISYIYKISRDKKVSIQFDTFGSGAVTNGSAATALFIAIPYSYLVEGPMAPTGQLKFNNTFYYLITRQNDATPSTLVALTYNDYAGAFNNVNANIFTGSTPGMTFMYNYDVY